MSDEYFKQNQERRKKKHFKPLESIRFTKSKIKHNHPNPKHFQYYSKLLIFIETSTIVEAVQLVSMQLSTSFDIEACLSSAIVSKVTLNGLDIVQPNHRYIQQL